MSLVVPFLLAAMETLLKALSNRHGRAHKYRPIGDILLCTGLRQQLLIRPLREIIRLFVFRRIPLLLSAAHGCWPGVANFTIDSFCAIFWPDTFRLFNFFACSRRSFLGTYAFQYSVVVRRVINVHIYQQYHYHWNVAGQYEEGRVVRESIGDEPRDNEHRVAQVHMYPEDVEERGEEVDLNVVENFFADDGSRSARWPLSCTRTAPLPTLARPSTRTGTPSTRSSARVAALHPDQRHPAQ